jgi:hypothetical protein
MNRWLNFREIKQSIPIEAVLGHYQWKYLRRRGDRVQGCCPIHRGQRTDAFNVDLRNNGFHCFSCQAHGGVLDLVVAMERCSLRQAGLLLTHYKKGASDAMDRLKGGRNLRFLPPLESPFFPSADRASRLESSATADGKEHPWTVGNI